MAESVPSPLLQRLATSLRLLSLRSDIDNIILELLGQFSLEKIYSEGDQEEYQTLVVTLLIQLNSIFSIQRLSLPSENLQVAWYSEFLASYEVTLRAVEYVLQVIVEGRETLWEARLLRDRYLAEFLLNALRFITLHPRIPSNQRGKDQRDRFARVHKLLERIFDSYPPPESSLLLVCRETTDLLRMRPNGLLLPPRLKTDLPNVATKLVKLNVEPCYLLNANSALVPSARVPPCHVCAWYCAKRWVSWRLAVTVFCPSRCLSIHNWSLSTVRRPQRDPGYATSVYICQQQRCSATSY